MTVSDPQPAIRAAIPSTREPVGLVFPRDFVAWQRWQHKQQPLLRRIRRGSDPSEVPGVLTLGGPEADIVVAVDSDTPSTTAAVVAPCAHIPADRLAILDRRPRPDLVGTDTPVRDVSRPADLIEAAPSLGTGLTIGAHLPLGNLVHQAFAGTDRHAFVAQHGLLVPHVPPLPENVTLLAWSDDDVTFWASGRSDVEGRSVGSQLLWEAAEATGAPVAYDAAPLFLGQLHAAELPRMVLARASIGFCRSHHARYRPHPSENDKVSRALHRTMGALGIEIDRSGTPLCDLNIPVVAVFSTGLLEAAAGGRPAWAYCPSGPVWVEEFWERYGISRWGDPPTPAPRRPEIEPAVAIARILCDASGDHP